MFYKVVIGLFVCEFRASGVLYGFVMASLTKFLWLAFFLVGLGFRFLAWVLGLHEASTGIYEVSMRVLHVLYRKPH